MAALALVLAAAAPVSLERPVPPPGPRQVNLTADSRPGWIPDEATEGALWGAAARYFEAVDAGDWRRAYAMMDEGLKAQLPFDAFERGREAERAEVGPLVRRRAIVLTWTADPANAPLPGIYAAIDIATQFANVDRQCGYVVFFRSVGAQDFVLVREESNRILNAAARQIVEKQSEAALEALWRQLSTNCPNQQAP